VFLGNDNYCFVDFTRSSNSLTASYCGTKSRASFASAMSAKLWRMSPVGSEVDLLHGVKKHYKRCKKNHEHEKQEAHEERRAEPTKVVDTCEHKFAEMITRP
jgi:hypothetical protein